MSDPNKQQQPLKQEETSIRTRLMGSLLLMAGLVKEEETGEGETEGGENRHMWGVQEGVFGQDNDLSLIEPSLKSLNS